MDFAEIKKNSPIYTPSMVSCATSPQNVSKNRYTDVLALNSTRVKLGEDERYINADYLMNGRLIACQAPIPTTVEDFLEMIVQEEPAMVVMLTRCQEGFGVKATPYWGYAYQNGQAVFGKYTVTTLDTLYPDVKESEYQHDLQIRHLQILEGNKAYSFVQIHYLGWPDMGVPKHPENLVDLIYAQVLIGATDTFAKRNTIVVHCSAGVGRTGVYCILSRIIDQVVHSILEKTTFYQAHPRKDTPKIVADIDKAIDKVVDAALQNEEPVPFSSWETLIPQMILSMRNERPLMVQKDEQYGFIFDSLDYFYSHAISVIEQYYEVADALEPLLQPIHKDVLLEFISRNQF
ncbi:protein-tyrosine phosphatase, putative [Entamoeba invadens IP1]|uniref:Protein-tyrosine phosphatase, putative n=1 Tax=Entamoeba invadens IP1 TaxID=370355 RepID=A0A0A1UAU9_ENTIV|nr:protein-tyrosine phosphatase, putative [Entamoeba invadens IP1]ELP92187.1 protein-tyrosine phosphatase, putative [Entamoeba invadens IP1]|eukprot:XP_004258958.1 protein-tyrosine phosphatase, putative [Entamoeba invadens IP1]